MKGTLGDPQSLSNESHNNELLEYPQYTRPVVYRGIKVPEVLLSGNHEKIADWRKNQTFKELKKEEKICFQIKTQKSNLKLNRFLGKKKIK